MNFLDDLYGQKLKNKIILVLWSIFIGMNSMEVLNMAFKEGSPCLLSLSNWIYGLMEDSQWPGEWGKTNETSLQCAATTWSC